MLYGFRVIIPYCTYSRKVSLVLTKNMFLFRKIIKIKKIKNSLDAGPFSRYTKPIMPKNGIKLNVEMEIEK